jgi:GT2 family glycosyltransferase
MDRNGGTPGRLSLQRALAMTGKALRLARTEGVQEVIERLRLRLQRRRDHFVYRAWVERYATLRESDRLAIRSRLRQLPYQPLISIVVPVYNTDETWLRQAIDSVLRQLYPQWELCLADDNSSRPHVRRVLEEYAGRDTRIKLVFRDSNGHISAASNSALEVATGDFIAFLDHDDELTEHALYMVIEELNRHPEADLLYSDEDKVDERGERYLPHFKPDWNPDLLRSINFLSHLVVCRAAVVKRLGGLRVGYEGAQDYDFVLRLVEAIPESHIRHIPHILYHWRSIPGSMARATGEKSYVYEAGRKALASHFERLGIAATVSDAPGCSYRPLYALAKKPCVSLVLSADNSAQFRRAVEVIRCTGYDALEVLMVLPQGYLHSEAIGALTEQHDPKLRSIQPPDNLSPTARLNYAARQTSGEILGFLGVVEPRSAGWLTEMVSHAVRTEIGAVGARLYGPRGTIDQAGLILGLRGLVGRAYHHVHPHIQYFGRMIERAGVIQNYSAVSGSCLVVRRQVYDEVGGFDETNLPSAYHDADFCLRIGEHGYRILWTPFAELRCIEPEGIGQSPSHGEGGGPIEQENYFRSRWGHILRGDPCYNPNLTLDREDFSLASPPRASRPWTTGDALIPVRRPHADQPA